MPTSLTLWTSNTNDTLLTTARQLLTASGTSSTNAFNSLIGTTTGYGELYAQGNTGAWAGLGSIGGPSGNGFILDATSLEGQQILAGTWTPMVRAKTSVGTITADIIMRAYVRSSGGVYTQIGTNMVLSGQTITTTSTNFTFGGTSQPVKNFGVGDKLYIDVWLNITSNSTGSTSATAGIVEALSSTNGAANASQTTTPGFQPIPPALGTSPSSLSFSGIVGGSSPPSQNSTLMETGGWTGTAWTSSISYGSGAGWLAISPSSGSLAAGGNQVVAFTVTPGALAAGTYTATVTYTATTGGATATVSVTFTVSAGGGTPSLATSPTSLAFSATFGGASPASMTSSLSETAGAGTAWTSSISYGSGSGWLSILPTSGSLSGLGMQTITVSPSTGSLAVGSYSATITFTATTGGSVATISIVFDVNPAPTTGPAPNTISLAGQDITLYVQQETLDIEDNLGQGPGAGSSGSTQGRAATIKFNTSLGPVAAALGAGQTIHPINGRPALVRQGEIIVTDASGTIVFGGFATKYTDSTTSILGNNLQNFTTIEGIDYSTSLQRTLVNEVFSAATDIQIITFVMQKYAPWVNLQYLPVHASYTFPIKNFRNVSVEQVIQTVAGVTGYLVYVDYLKNLRYIAPTVASSTPFNLADNPDFVTTFPHAITEYVVDDNSAINRVFFFGGTKLSNDFTQDVSPLANGNNKVFTLAYFPTASSDGKYHVTLNGTEQVVGIANSTGANNTLISDGGLAQALIDPGSRSLTFSTAPAAGATILVKYRYSFPLSILLTDENSHQFFGSPYLDGFINDNTIFDLATGVQRCKVLLSQQSFGLVSLKVDTYKAGIQSGMLIHIKNTVRGLDATFLVQGVQINPLGGGNFVYHLSLGAWNWNLIDFLLKFSTLASFQDAQPDELTDTVVIEQILSNVRVHDAWSKKTSTGPYYARSAPVGDGHDAYPGFATISS